MISNGIIVYRVEVKERAHTNVDALLVKDVEEVQYANMVNNEVDVGYVEDQDADNQRVGTK